MTKILIIEPDKILARIYQDYLIQNNFKVEIALNAQDAMEVIDSFCPNLILIEIKLAKNSGVELLREVRSYRDLDQIKIIIFSSILFRIYQKKWKNIAQDFKISRYIYKPEASLNHLLLNINEVLSY